MGKRREIELTRAVCERVNIPVIVSGGGALDPLYEGSPQNSSIKIQAVVFQ